MKIPANDSNPFSIVNSINNSYINTNISVIQSNSTDLAPVIAIFSVIVVIAVISVVFYENRKSKNRSKKKSIKQRPFREHLVKRISFKKFVEPENYRMRLLKH